MQCVALALQGQVTWVSSVISKCPCSAGSACTSTSIFNVFIPCNTSLASHNPHRNTHTTQSTPHNLHRDTHTAPPTPHTSHSPHLTTPTSCTAEASGVRKQSTVNDPQDQSALHNTCPLTHLTRCE